MAEHDGWIRWGLRLLWARPISTTGVAVAMYAAYYLLLVANKPKLVFSARADSKLLSAIRQCPSLGRRYYPCVWAFNAHAQLLLLALLGRRARKENHAREILQLPDGGTVALDWFGPVGGGECKQRESGRKVLLVLHGLTGDGDDPLVGRVVEEAVRYGWTCVGYSRRGHGGIPLSTPRLTSFGDTSDLRCVLTHLRSGAGPLATSDPSDADVAIDRLCAVGISAGSAMLAKYLGEAGAASVIDGGVCISPGYDIDAMIRGSVPALYNRALTANLKKKLRPHRHDLAMTIDVDHALSAGSWCEFDERVFCPLYQCSIDEFYQRNNPMVGIEAVRTPTLCINSLDDPVCVRSLIPVEQFKTLEFAALATTSRGSHCTFFEGLSVDSNWAARVAVEFVNGIASIPS